MYIYNEEGACDVINWMEAMIRYGLVAVADIRDEFDMGDCSNAFNLIASAVLFSSLTVLGFLFLERNNPAVIGNINSKILVPLTGGFSIPVFALSDTVYWAIFGAFSVISIGILIYEIVHTKMYCIPVILGMLFCGFCLTHYIICVLLGILMVIYLGIKILLLIAGVLFVGSCLEGISKSEPTRYFVVNKKTYRKSTKGL